MVITALSLFAASTAPEKTGKSAIVSSIAIAFDIDSSADVRIANSADYRPHLPS
jgi:hypothetical protein